MQLDRRVLVGMVQKIIVNNNRDFEIRYRYAYGFDDTVLEERMVL
jgi:hypothetical protein